MNRVVPIRIYGFIFLLFFSLLSLSLDAQNSELKVMYSPVSLQRMEDWGRNHHGLTARYAGAFMIEYNYYIKPGIKVGINVAYDKSLVAGTKTDTVKYPGPFNNNDYTISHYQQSNKSSYLFFSPQIGYEYIQTENFRMGSLIGLSMVFINWEDKIDSKLISKGTDINMFFHAELINFTWGNSHGLTGQLGFGYKGLVSLGYFFRW